MRLPMTAPRFPATFPRLPWFDGMPSAAAVLAQGGVVLIANQRARTLLRGDVVGMNIERVLAPVERFVAALGVESPDDPRRNLELGVRASARRWSAST